MIRESDPWTYLSARPMKNVRIGPSRFLPQSDRERPFQPADLSKPVEVDWAGNRPADPGLRQDLPVDTASEGPADRELRRDLLIDSGSEGPADRALGQDLLVDAAPDWHLPDDLQTSLMAELADDRPTGLMADLSDERLAGLMAELPDDRPAGLMACYPDDRRASLMAYCLDDRPANPTALPAAHFRADRSARTAPEQEAEARCAACRVCCLLRVLA